MNEKRLLRLQLASMLALVFTLITIIGTGGYFIWQQIDNYLNDSQSIDHHTPEANYAHLDETLQMLQVRLQHQRFEQELNNTNNLRQPVEYIAKLATSLYNSEAKHHNLQQVQYLATEAVRTMLFGSDYVLAIYDQQGSLLFSNQPSEIAASPEWLGALRYAVSHPQSKGFGEVEDKLFFVKQLDELGWLVSLSITNNRLEARTQKTLLEDLLDIPVDDNIRLMVLHQNGHWLMYQDRPGFEGLHYSKLPPSEQQLAQRLLRQENFNDYHQSLVIRPFGNWILAAQLTPGSAPAALNERRQTLQNNIEQHAFNVVLVITPLLLCVLLLSGWVSRWLLKGFARSHAKLEESNQQLTIWAESDPLTGLPNRNLLRKRLEQALTQARRENCKLALMCIDLDRFKNINDSLGHAVGDELLIEVSQRLTNALGEGNTLCRLGGDEFVVLIEHLKHAEHAAKIADDLLKACATSYHLGGHELVITLSLGIALYPEDGIDSDTLFKNADAAMYHAKAQGRNTCQFFTLDLHDRVREHLELESRLRQALSRNEISLHYQPQIDLNSGQLIGCEALMRWESPQLGRIPPDKFIGVAEDSGIILQLGEWALFEACRQAMEWRAQGLPSLRMSVNVSALQFRHSNLALLVEQALQHTGLPAEYLELELTESVLAENLDQVKSTLDRLKQMGVHLAMDDFGTGYSSLAYLRQLHLDTLKIDRTFVNDLPNSEDCAALATAIVNMGEALGMRCVAEGIENDDQLSFLRWHGCHIGQGYFFSRPLDACNMRAYLANYTPPKFENELLPIPEDGFEDISLAWE